MNWGEPFVIWNSLRGGLSVPVIFGRMCLGLVRFIDLFVLNFVLFFKFVLASWFLTTGSVYFVPIVLFMFLIYLFFILFYFFWLCWVFVAARRLSLVAPSGGYSSLWCAAFSLRNFCHGAWVLGARASVVAAHRLSSCSTRALEHVGFSSCGVWASVVVACGLSSCGTKALGHVGFSSCGMQAQ